MLSSHSHHHSLHLMVVPLTSEYPTLQRWERSSKCYWLNSRWALSCRLHMSVKFDSSIYESCKSCRMVFIFIITTVTHWALNFRVHDVYDTFWKMNRSFCDSFPTIVFLLLYQILFSYQYQVLDNSHWNQYVPLNSLLVSLASCGYKQWYVTVVLFWF